MAKLPKGMHRRGRSFYYREQQGSRDVRRSLGPDYQEALRRFRELRQGRTLELPTRAKGFDRALEEWLQTAVATARIPSGRKDVASRMNRYALPYFRSTPLPKLVPADLLGFRSHLERRGLRVTLVHRILSDLRAFFRWAALEARVIGSPPIPRRLMPRLQQTFPERLSDEEVAKVSATPEPYGFAVRFALATGLRWGELTRATSRDVHHGMLLVSRTKSGRTRKVPLAPGILQELRRRVGRLVPFEHPGSFAKRVRAFSGVRRFHMHLTRHTFACRWVEAGGNLAVLQAILGHSSVVVTQRYARLTEDAIVREAARIAGQSGTGAGTGGLEVEARRGVSVG